MPAQHSQQRVPLLVGQRVSQEDDPSPLQALSPYVNDVSQSRPSKPSVKTVCQKEDTREADDMRACVGREGGGVKDIQSSDIDHSEFVGQTISEEDSHGSPSCPISLSPPVKTAQSNPSVKAKIPRERMALARAWGVYLRRARP